MKIFPRPNLTPEKHKENLEYDINALQIKYEKLESCLEAEYQKKREERIKMLDELDWNGFCKQKEELIEKQNDVNKREKNILQRENDIEKKEKDCENKIKEVNLLVGEMLRGALRKQK